jgi:hypothetical protein
LGASLSSFTVAGWTSRSSLDAAAWLRYHSFSQLPWAFALLQSASDSEQPPFAHHRCKQRWLALAGSSHEVWSPSAYPRTRQRPDDAVCLTTSPAPSGFLNLSTLWSAPCLLALFHASVRSWGCALQSFAPLAWPCAVSDAVPLMTFKRPVNTTANIRRTAPKRCSPSARCAQALTCDLNRSPCLHATSPLPSDRSHRSARSFENRRWLALRAAAEAASRPTRLPVLLSDTQGQPSQHRSTNQADTEAPTKPAPKHQPSRHRSANQANTEALSPPTPKR